MNARRLVAKIRHRTGSMHRGASREIPRDSVADAIRTLRRWRPGTHPSGMNALRMLNPASSIPTRAEYLTTIDVDRANW